MIKDDFSVIDIYYSVISDIFSVKNAIFLRDKLYIVKDNHYP